MAMKAAEGFITRAIQGGAGSRDRVRTGQSRANKEFLLKNLAP